MEAEATAMQAVEESIIDDLCALDDPMLQYSYLV